MIYRTRGEHSNHYTTDAVPEKSKIIHTGNLMEANNISYINNQTIINGFCHSQISYFHFSFLFLIHNMFYMFNINTYTHGIYIKSTYTFM